MLAQTAACGDDPPVLTDAFDGTWELSLFGADCEGGPDLIDLTDGNFSGTADVSGTGCTAGTTDADGYLSPGAGEPANFPDFGAIHLRLDGDPETFYLTGTLTASGGSGTWASSTGLEGSFVLLVP